MVIIHKEDRGRLLPALHLKGQLILIIMVKECCLFAYSTWRLALNFKRNIHWNINGPRSDDDWFACVWQRKSWSETFQSGSGTERTGWGWRFRNNTDWMFNKRRSLNEISARLTDTDGKLIRKVNFLDVSLSLFLFWFKSFKCIYFVKALRICSPSPYQRLDYF